jgi:glucose/arabinose dehydrogenase
MVPTSNSGFRSLVCTLASGAMLVSPMSGCSSDTSDTSSDAAVDQRVLPDSEPAWPDATHAVGLDERPSNASCVAFERPRADPRVRLVEAFPRLPALRKPLFLAAAPGDVEHIYVIEQEGRLLRFDRRDPKALEVVIDLRDRVESGPGEAGLLGLAFAPDFASSGKLYLSYTRQDRSLRSRISRWESTDGGASIGRGSEEVLLDIAQPYGNHNGGHIAFGPPEGPGGTRYLYIGLGDGGSGGDPQGNGQDTDTLLGSILRIDVGSDADAPYGIPPGNPFVGGEGGLPEIYAWGLRNPWRFSFDRASGELWAGDVGQSSVEEIDRISLGGNYGWNVREGTKCFRDTCDVAALVDPVIEYGRDEGRSVTGGYVYRGSAVEDLVGRYIYGDYVSGRIWQVDYDREGAAVSRLLIESGVNISSFAQDAEGELYVLDYGGGRVLRLASASERSVGEGPPFLLSKTGCFEQTDPRQPSAGVIP